MELFNKKSLQLAKGKKILIVEDNRVDRIILRSMLKMYFDVIVLAKDGEEGYKKYLQERFDIVLTDIMMPKMDGVELIQKIKKFDKCQPVAVISSVSDSDRLIELIDLGINTFILKPLDKDVILTKIGNLLENIYYKREIEKLAFKEYLFRKLNPNIEESKKKSIKSKKSIDTIRVEKSIIDTHEDDLATNENMFEISHEEQSEIAFLSSTLEDYINHIIFDSIDSDSLHHISDLFRKIGNILSNIDHFRETSLVFLDLGKIIDQHLNVDDKKPFELLELLWVDIEEFLYGVFLERNVDKIGYFTNSLKSNLINLEAKLDNKSVETETEFTLF